MLLWADLEYRAWDPYLEFEQRFTLVVTVIVGVLVPFFHTEALSAHGSESEGQKVFFSVSSSLLKL